MRFRLRTLLLTVSACCLLFAMLRWWGPAAVVPFLVAAGIAMRRTRRDTLVVVRNTLWAIGLVVGGLGILVAGYAIFFWMLVLAK